MIKFNAEDLQVFEYLSEEEAKKEIEKVSTDGSSVGTTMITWMDTPHFFLVWRDHRFVCWQQS